MMEMADQIPQLRVLQIQDSLKAIFGDDIWLTPSPKCGFEVEH
jgi:hypothetical protein